MYHLLLRMVLFVSWKRAFPTLRISSTRLPYTTAMVIPGERKPILSFGESTATVFSRR